MLVPSLTCLVPNPWDCRTAGHTPGGFVPVAADDATGTYDTEPAQLRAAEEVFG